MNPTVTARPLAACCSVLTMCFLFGISASLSHGTEPLGGDRARDRSTELIPHGEPNLGLRPVFDENGRSPYMSKLGPEVLFVFGAPGSNEGTFQDLAGQPDWQGWTSFDRNATLLADNHWHAYDPQIAPSPIDLTPTSSATEQFGRALAAIDSLAGDGRVTLVVGANSTISSTGSIRIYLGEDIGLDTPTWTTFQGEDGYGISLADMGDIDGDGDHELLVGATATTGPGAVYAYFGEPGIGLDSTTPDLSFAPDVALGSFGSTVAGIGDFNGDGYDDWAIKAGKKLYVYFGSSVPDAVWDLELGFPHIMQFGWCIAGGDIDGDGYSDMLVGEPGGIVRGVSSSWAGRVHIFRGSAAPSLSIGLYIDGVQTDAGFGASIAVVPPMDGGAAQDFVVGEPFASGGLGAVHLYEGGASPTLYRSWYSSPAEGEFGWSVTALRNLAPAGNTAFVVGQPGESATGFYAGRCQVIVAGPDSSRSYLLGPGPASRFGESVVDLTGVAGSSPAFAASAPMYQDPGGMVQVHVLGGMGPMLYCGDQSPPADWESAGYGDNWNDALGWYGDVPDSRLSTEVCLDLTARIETEAFYDFVRFEYVTSSGLETLDEVAGFQDLTRLHYCMSYSSSDYVTNPFTGNPAVHLRISVDSDNGWSDQSGGVDTELGAVLLTDIDVTMNGLPVSTASIEPDASDDSPGGRGFPGFDTDTWFREDVLFGDFSKLIDGFSDLDPLRENPSPQMAFIDDGTPPRNDPLNRSTGGSTGSTNYGVPGDWVLNFTGGLSDNVSTLVNEVWSPAMAWDDTTTTDDDGYDFAILSFDAWLHLPYENGFGYAWKLRYSLDPAGSGWEPWQTNNFIYFHPYEPQYETINFAIGDRVPPEASWLQVALIAYDASRGLGFPGGDATPSPTFDNIRVFKQFNSTVTTTTPVGSAVPVDLNDVQLEFENVSTEGETTVVTQLTFGHPATFYLSTDPLSYFEISTTASYSDSITICIAYDEASLVIPEEEIRLIHHDGELGWVDITQTLDTVADIVCGKTDTLSPFALAKAVSPTGTPPERAPTLTRLHPPHPNPFNPRTVIRYELAQAGPVELSIHDVRGRLVRRLENGPRPAGSHELIWNGTDSSGRGVASGVYFVRLVSSSYRAEQKVTLVR